MTTRRGTPPKYSQTSSRPAMRLPSFWLKVMCTYWWRLCASVTRSAQATRRQRLGGRSGPDGFVGGQGHSCFRVATLVANNDGKLKFTTATLDPFASIADGSRESLPIAQPYHENLVHQAVFLGPGTPQAQHHTWWR